jgi:hypothetical protein
VERQIKVISKRGKENGVTVERYRRSVRVVLLK